MSRPVLRAKASISTIGSLPDQENAPPKVTLLYSHTSCRIVNFTSKVTTLRAEGPPPSSEDERTVATGELKVYKTNGMHNVTFLTCGSVTHPIMPRLRCWRVGRWKFVLPTPAAKYWRVELTDNDIDAANRLEQVLSGILAYEREQAPFRRSVVIVDESSQRVVGTIGKNVVRSGVVRLPSYKEMRVKTEESGRPGTGSGEAPQPWPVHEGTMPGSPVKRTPVDGYDKALWWVAKEDDFEQQNLTGSISPTKLKTLGTKSDKDAGAEQSEGLVHADESSFMSNTTAIKEQVDPSSQDSVGVLNSETDDHEHHAEPIIMPPTPADFLPSSDNSYFPDDPFTAQFDGTHTPMTDMTDDHDIHSASGATVLHVEVKQVSSSPKLRVRDGSRSIVVPDNDPVEEGLGVPLAHSTPKKSVRNTLMLDDVYVPGKTIGRSTYGSRAERSSGRMRADQIFVPQGEEEAEKVEMTYPAWLEIGIPTEEDSILEEDDWYDDDPSYLTSFPKPAPASPTSSSLFSLTRSVLYTSSSWLASTLLSSARKITNAVTVAENIEQANFQPPLFRGSGYGYNEFKERLRAEEDYVDLDLDYYEQLQRICVSALRAVEIIGGGAFEAGVLMAEGVLGFDQDDATLTDDDEKV
ncbi:hypothetical protein SAICODRAFT_108383 [Saitoella complicata NRRL Y-17804]|nr:uncharacterized protein SAICODRAFT_108383 [Saitoella complicata NRRL Y-17804]ODQ56429.1 hypothetical protein SAICODRAFT_108383 [Saitoella complicata NRRL Y-17804]